MATTGPPDFLLVIPVSCRAPCFFYEMASSISGSPGPVGKSQQNTRLNHPFRAASHARLNGGLVSLRTYDAISGFGNARQKSVCSSMLVKWICLQDGDHMQSHGAPPQRCKPQACQSIQDSRGFRVQLGSSRVHAPPTPA
jgi:hypothetical protein